MMDDRGLYSLLAHVTFGHWPQVFDSVWLITTGKMLLRPTSSPTRTLL
jgi:hypothetical protein